MTYRDYISKQRNAGRTYREIGDKLGVSHQAIYQIYKPSRTLNANRTNETPLFGAGLGATDSWIIRGWPEIELQQDLGHPLDPGGSSTLAALIQDRELPLDTQ